MKTGGLISAATPRKRRLLSNTHGSMTIPGIIFFTVLMAVSGLAIDMERVFGVHGQMQAFVDSVALASAAELDGQSTALTRALRAANGISGVGPLVSGPAQSARFATDTTLTVQKVTFLETLGTDPGPLAATPAAGDEVLCTYTAPSFTAVCAAGETAATASIKAKFVEIVASPRTVSYIVLPVANAFGQVFGSGQLQATLALRATAGFRRAICNTVPLMVCNPAEQSSGKGADFTFAQGKMMLPKLNDGWDPPNFGLLDNFPGTGASDMSEAFARVSPGTICTEDQITVRTGSVTGPTARGFNVRFDMYDGPFGSESANPQYAPAPNVARGMEPGSGKNGACSPTVADTSDSMPFPRDDCFYGFGAPCGNYNGGDPRFGDGQWNRAMYWARNHPLVSPPTGYIDATSPIGGWTRYQTYRYEIEHPQQVNFPGEEQGGPACSTSTPDLNRDRDRRILYVAVVNCVENAAQVGHGPVPVKAYAKVFLTEPVGFTEWDKQSRTYDGKTYNWSITNKDIAIEIVDVVKPNDESGHLHVYPVLYR